MYIRTPHALVWVEPLLEPVQQPVKHQATDRNLYQEIWAKKPLNLPRGRCVAVRQSAGKIEVGCMAGNRLIWLSTPHEALPEKQLQKWLRNEF